MELLLLGIGVYLLRNYISDANKFLKDVQFSFSDISLLFPETLQSGFTKLFLNLTVSVSNKTDFEITLLKIYTDIYYQNTLIGTISKSGSVKIVKQSIVTDKLPAVVDTSNVVNIIKGIIDGNSGPVTFVLKGYADITLGRINFTQTKTFNV